MEVYAGKAHPDAKPQRDPKEVGLYNVSLRLSSEYLYLLRRGIQ